jgi:cell division protein FtsQ
VAAAPRLTRDLGDDFGRRFEDWDQDPDPKSNTKSGGFDRRRQGKGVRLRLGGGLPRTALGRTLFLLFLLFLLSAVTYAAFSVRQALLTDRRFAIPSSSAIQITGNSHLTRAQLISVFGEDVDRNSLTIPLAERRAELERLPWVAHATVMRLLPNRIRVSIVERVPVAFYRQGGHIGLVDANGVLLDMPDTAEQAAEQAGDEAKQVGEKSAASQPTPAEHYSFPVVTGLGEDEPLSTRAARMKLYMRFVGDLNRSQDRISDRLSEVDLTSPEDVKALIPTGTSAILVHFGDGEFLERYRRFEQNLPKWQQDYPKLASADMRYPRQVVLEMQPGTAVPLTGEQSPEAVTPKAAAKPGKSGPADKAKAAGKSAPPHPASKRIAPGHPAPAHPAVHPAPAAGATPAQPHLETAFDVPSSKTSNPSRKPGTAASNAALKPNPSQADHR